MLGRYLGGMVLAMSAFTGHHTTANFATGPRAGTSLSRVPRVARGVSTLSELGPSKAQLSDATAEATKVLAGATEAESAASSTAYELWADQFPIAAARREYYGLPSARVHVRSRFLRLAQIVGVSAQEALDIFRRDLWVLTEPSDRIAEKMAVLRDIAGSEEEVLDFLRFAPRSIATTSADEIRQRGLANMRLRSILGEAYEALVSPLRFVIMQSARATAREIQCKSSVDDECEVEVLQGVARDTQEKNLWLTNVFFAAFFGVLSWAAYLDTYYGGPIHGKGICFPALLPAYSLPDAEGNARLPCSCAPLYKWYIEPLLTAEQRAAAAGMAPKVESKNCGRSLLNGGEKVECDPTTVGGCVWTAEDLAKDPSTWDRRELTYWERQRKL